MERLTERSHIYYACEFMDSGLEKQFNKLAEYEDAELTPKEIEQLKQLDESKENHTIQLYNQLMETEKALLDIREQRDYWEREAKK